MNNKTSLFKDNPSTLRICRLIGCALLMAGVLLFVPFSLGNTLQVWMPDAAQTVSFGISPVQASGGLTITKRAIPTSTVGQGELITYTLRLTNETGTDLTYVIVTDTVPAKTTCYQYFKPANWAGNPDSCTGGESTWVFVDVSGQPFADGDTEEFTYVVRVDKPLPNGQVIENLAASYGAGSVLPVVFSASGETDVSTTVKAPVWKISKTSDPTDTVEAGNLIEYTITVTNTGDWETDGVFTITDVIPMDTAYEATLQGPTPDGIPASEGDVITWTVTGKTIEPGNSDKVRYTVRVTKPLTPGTIITNTTYGVRGGNVFTDIVSTVPITVEIIAGPELIITKTANTANVKPGDLITYTIIYENIGSNTATNPVVITDTIPDNTSFFSCTPATQTQVGSKEFGWFTPTLPIDQPHIITLTVEVDNPLPDNLVLTNTVIVTSSGVFSATDQVTVTVVSKPVLEVTKTSSEDPILAGDDLVYTIIISNNGTATATNVLVTDTLDSWTDFQDAAPTPASSTPDIVFNPFEILPGQKQTILITATVSPTTPHGTILSNQVKVTSTETDTVTIVEETTVNAPIFEISKAVDPTTVLAGEYLTYTIRYTNSNNIPATNIRLTDTLPISMNMTTVLSDTDGATFAGMIGPYTLVFTQATLVLDTNVITIWGQVINSPWPSTPLDLINLVTATLDIPPTVFTQTVTSSGQPNVPDTIILEVDPTTTVVKNNVALTATIRDQYGNLVVNGETVTFTTSLIGSSFTSADAGTTDGQAKATLTSTAPGTTTVRVEAGSQSAAQVVTFTAAALGFSKQVDKTIAGLDDTLVYTIVVTNSGSTTATNVVVTDTMPTHTSFVTATIISNSVSSPISPVSTDPHRFELGVLLHSPVSTITLIITATINPTAPNGEDLVNQAQVTAPQTTTMATALATTTVEAPAFNIVKTAIPDHAYAGGKITYTIVYSNEGAISANNVFITDTLPLSFSNVISDPGPGANLSQVISNILVFEHSGALGPSEVNTITIVGQLIETPWPPTTLNLTNRLTATIDINPAPFLQSTTTGVSPGPPAIITITAVPTETLVGNSVAITAEITDQYGNPITNGQTVDFSSTLVGSNIVPASATSNNGVVNATLTSSQAGVTTVIVEVGSISQTTAVTFTAPSLRIGKTGFPSPVPPGGALIYTILVTNTGNSIINNVVVTDLLSLESRTQFVSADTPYTEVNGNYFFNLGNFTPGMTRTIVLTVTVVSAVEDDILLNIVQARADETGVFQYTAQTPVSATPFQLSKAVTPNPVVAGGILTYTITYLNNTDAPITNIRLTDTLPVSLTNIVIDPGNASTVDAVEPTLVFTQASLAASQQEVITIAGQVITTSGWSADGTSLTNYVTATTSLNVPAVNAQAAVQVRPAAPATIVITATPLFTIVGASVQVVATVKDQFGNPVYNDTSVTFNSSSPDTTIQSPRPTVNGIATALLNATAPATTTVTATAGGKTSNEIEVVFRVDPTSPAALTITAVPLATTADNPIQVTAAVKDYRGDPVADGVQVNFSSSSPNTTIESPRSTVGGVATATLRAINPITTTTTVTATVLDDISDSIEVTFTKPPAVISSIYLPLIVKNYPPLPTMDLVVDLIEVVPASPTTSQEVVIYVTIRNTGTLAVSSFWVDLYLSTERIVPQVNQPWIEVAPLGVAWIVPTLGPGESLTLSNLQPDNYSDPTDCHSYSYFTPETVGNCTWPGNSNIFPEADTYYATVFVDSFGDDDTPGDGNVTEVNENNNVYPTPVTIVVTGAAKTPDVNPAYRYTPTTPGQPRPPLTGE